MDELYMDSSLQAPRKDAEVAVSLEQMAVIAILRAAGNVHRAASRVLATRGLSPSQYNVLRILRGAPDGLATMEIRDKMIEERPGITRLIDGLERDGLAVRVRRAGDRRCVDCRITTTGLDLLAALDPVIDGLDRRLLGSIPQTELRRLVGVLGLVTDKADR